MTVGHKDHWLSSSKNAKCNYQDRCILQTRTPAGSEDGQKLRKKLAEATKYLRICSFTGDQFCQEVGTSGVLNCNELQLAVTSIGKKRKCEELTEFSNEVEPRKKLRSKPESVKRKRDYFYDGILPLACSGRSPNNFRKIFSFVIRTKKHPIELVSWNCLSWDGWRCNNKTVRVVCETKITELPQHKSCNVYTSMVSKDVTGGCSVELNLADDDCNVSLPPNKEYQISISYAGLVSQIIDLEYKYENEYMVFSVPGSEENNFLWRLCPVISFRYNIIKEED